jgi:NADH-quinone oxidoreductase subunit A
VLRSYLPALVFVGLGLGIGGLFVFLGRLLGPKRNPREEVRAGAYESGLASVPRTTAKFGISFYLVGLMFIIFDLEVLLLLPTSMVLREFGVHGLLSVGLFLVILTIALVYEWRRGALDWRD